MSATEPNQRMPIELMIDVGVEVNGVHVVNEVYYVTDEYTLAEITEPGLLQELIGMELREVLERKYTAPDFDAVVEYAADLAVSPR